MINSKAFLLVGMLAITSCASNQISSSRQTFLAENSAVYKNDASGIESIMSNKALDRYKNKYVSAKANKAFAQSVSGAWAFRTGRTSIEHAKTNALVGCQANNNKHEVNYPCKIININNEWVGE